MATTQLNIQGMSCGGCVNSVSKALQAQAGVGSVEVSLEQGWAKVDYESAQTTPAQLAEAINRIGFEAAPAG